MGYFQGGDYVRKVSSDDKVAVLACQLRVWKASAPNWFDEDAGTFFTEVESIEIQSSFANVVGTATIKLPRGATLAKSMSKDNDNPSVQSGNGSNLTSETQLIDQTESGQILSEGSSVDTDGKPTLSIESGRDDGGLLEIKHEEERLVISDDFAVGNRIEIRLGYLYEPEIPGEDSVNEKMKLLRDGKRISEVTTVFHGFITGCSPTSPIEIQCEDMVSLLKKKGCPVIPSNKAYTVKDFFISKNDGGVFDLLNGTGLSLSDVTKQANISVGKVNIDKNNVVSDLIADWINNCGLAMFLESDGKSIRIGRKLYTGQEVENNVEYINYSGGASAKYIQFDWDVAKDDLSVFKNDPNFIVVEAQGVDKDNKLIKVIVRKPAGTDTNGETEWDYINEQSPKDKKSQKRRGGQTRKRQNIKISNYVTLHYKAQPRPGGITMDQLKEEARNFWKANAENGVKGSITIFGDRDITPGNVVCLIDPRQPEKQGYYLVESVTITFGVNTGYRKELKLPYRITNYDKPITYIT